MIHQADLFADGAADSIPPWQDPACVSDVCVCFETDRDHVGAQAIGRVGNNTDLDVVKVLGTDGAVLHSESFPRPSFGLSPYSTYSRAAHDRAAQIRRLIAQNRQTRLFS
jgi:hypothetical protein